VVSLGLDPIALDGVETEPRVLDRDIVREISPRLYAALHGSAAPLIVVMPAGSDRARRRLQTVGSALDGSRSVAHHETGLPPLAASTLVALASALCGHAPSAGRLAGALPALEHEIVAAAVVSSVLRLKRPRPGVMQRVRSALPGGRFVVRAQPDPLVRPLRRHGGIEAITDGLAPDAALIVAGRVRGADWADRALDAAGAHRVDPAPEASSWWRSAATEIVAFPTDLAALAARLFGEAPAAPCPWCGEPASTLPCPLCGHDRNRGLQVAA
jgi:hypothetical protein